MTMIVCFWTLILALNEPVPGGGAYVPDIRPDNSVFYPALHEIERSLRQKIELDQTSIELTQANTEQAALLCLKIAQDASCSSTTRAWAIARGVGLCHNLPLVDNMRHFARCLNALHLRSDEGFQLCAVTAARLASSLGQGKSAVSMSKLEEAEKEIDALLRPIADDSSLAEFRRAQINFIWAQALGDLNGIAAMHSNPEPVSRAQQTLRAISRSEKQLTLYDEATALLFEAPSDQVQRRLREQAAATIDLNRASTVQNLVVQQKEYDQIVSPEIGLTLQECWEVILH